MYHPSMGYPAGYPPYGYGQPGPAPNGYAEFEMMQQLQRTMHAYMMSTQGGAMPQNGGGGGRNHDGNHPRSPQPPAGRPPPAPPPLPPGGISGAPADANAGAAYQTLTAEALRRYQQEGAAADLDADGDGSSNSGDSNKQSVARRRHARRRRQLARLTTERLEWEERSRLMEEALLAKDGDGEEGLAALPEEELADYRKALARTLLLTSEVLRGSDHDGADSDGAYSDELSDADSGDLTERLVSELRGFRVDEGDGEGDGGDAGETTTAPAKDADDAEKEKEKAPSSSTTPKRRSIERARCNPATASLAAFLGGYQSTFTGMKVNPACRGSFDPKTPGMEGVAALEYGLIKAQESGLFAPGEILVTAVSTKDMLIKYSSGNSADVLGVSSAERVLRTSLFESLHAEDVRALIFACYLFPTILPEIRGGDAAGEEGTVPKPECARLMPHGFLRRRRANGTHVAMERLGGVIVTNDDAAALMNAARGPAKHEMSVLTGFGEPGEGSSSPEDVSPRSLSQRNSENVGAFQDASERGRAAEILEEETRRRSDEMTRTQSQEELETIAECARRVSIDNGDASLVADVSTPSSPSPPIVLNKYHPSMKREAKRSGGAKASGSSPAELLGRASKSDVSPSTGAAFGAKSEKGAALSPHAAKFEAGAGLKPTGSATGAGVDQMRSVSVRGVTGESKLDLKLRAGAGRSGAGAGAAGVKTSEADLTSLVAHCVRHTEKAAVEGEGEGEGAVVNASMPEEIREVLQRLTRETFSENTMMVMIERVRGAGGGVGAEARHNSQMMVVSKLLNDLTSRSQRAWPSPGGKGK
jgi:hypothetical protein